jgi:hypothetical protein
MPASGEAWGVFNQGVVEEQVADFATSNFNFRTTSRHSSACRCHVDHSPFTASRSKVWKRFRLYVGGATSMLESIRSPGLEYVRPVR